MLLDERAAVIGPFEDDRLPRVVGEALRLPVAVERGEVGRLGVDSRHRRQGRHAGRGEGGSDGKGEAGDETARGGFFHDAYPRAAVEEDGRSFSRSSTTACV